MIELTSDETVWNGWCEAVEDVYYRWDHLQIWADEWECEPVGLRYRDEGGSILLPLLREDLGRIPGGEGCCDLRTAYDFGGPLSSGSPKLEVFETALEACLNDLGCVTLFMRIHPFHAYVPSDAELHADHQVVDLTPGLEAVRASSYGSWRRDRNKAERRGCSTAVETDAELFCRLYAATMDRVNAPPWYRFSRPCLESLIALEQVDQLVTRGPDARPLATALSLRSGRVRFYHLSASERNTGLFPSHHLLDGLIRHAIEDGCATVHLGGGAPDLRRFKSRVATGTVPYRVVKRVVNPQRYRLLCDATGCAGPAFPRYLGWMP